MNRSNALRWLIAFLSLAASVEGQSARPEDQLFSPHTIGHGSFSGCIFLIDLDRDLIVVQVRKQGGERYNDWAPKFLEAIVDLVKS